jgi:hypothetical protein
MFVNPFNPRPASGQTASSGAASATLTFTGGAVDDLCFRVVNKDATNGVYVRICSGTAVAATAADTFVRPNSEIVLYKGQGADLLTYIQSVGAVSFFVQTGNGGT